MQEGKILAASHHGAYVIRLEGDVRLTLCTTIDDYVQKMFDDPDFVHRIAGLTFDFNVQMLDLLVATGLDVLIIEDDIADKNFPLISPIMLGQTLVRALAMPKSATTSPPGAPE